MKKWLTERPTSVTAALVFLAVTTAWLVPIGIGAGIARRSQQLVRDSDHVQRLALQAGLDEKLFVVRDLRSGEFYTTGQAQHLEDFHKAISALEVALQALRPLVPNTEIGVVEKAQARLGEYRAAFDAEVEGFRRQGYKDWGLEGRWRAAAHELESRIPAAGDGGLITNLLELRRREKDYLLRREEQYADMVKSYIEEMRRKIVLKKERDRAELLTRLDAYAAAFQEYRAVEKEVGADENSGQQLRARLARENLDGLMVHLGKVGVDSWETNRIRVLFSAVLSATGMGGLMAGVFVLLARAYRQEREIEKLEMIRRASEAKGRFLAGVSHELRNPLSAIIGFSELLEEETSPRLSETEKRKLSHIVNNSQHMLHLVNDLLDLSRIESGKVQLRRTLVAFRDILQEVLPTVESAAAEKHLDIRVGPNVNVEVFADPLRFKQILLNLIGNAVKFTPPGGAVEVGVKSTNGSACLFVRDTGPGIRPEDQGRVFDEFFRGSVREDDSVKGTGLGLAITRRLVEQHGGRIWVESQPGRGTEFFFTLPQEAHAG